MRRWKSVGAIVAGFAFVVVFSTGTDMLLEMAGVFPPISSGPFDTGLLLLALAYRSLFAVGAGFIVASLAPDHPWRHATILGAIGTAAGLVGVFAGWNLSAHWYPIALALTAYPLIWLGARIKLRHR